MVLYILRGAFVLLAASVSLLYILSYQTASIQQASVGNDNAASYGTIVAMVGVAAGVAGAVVAIDMFARSKKLSALSGIFLGLLAGLLAAFALAQVIDLIGLLFEPESQKPSIRNLLEGVKVFIGLITCYLGISMVIQTKDDFRFVIPYVEFAKQIRGNKPTLLDTSVIIDGRIVDVIDTQFMQGTLIVAKFVLNELQTIADSPDNLRRARGRRGLEMLQNLQDNPLVDVTIDDTEAEGATVDQKLVALAKLLQARIMTNDYNLNKIAKLRGMEVININDLAQSLRPVVLPGEAMTVKIIKPGEGPDQGVGYLDDGTMIVVENARSMVGQTIDLIVTSMLQTSAGRMIFGKIAAEHTAPAPNRSATQPPTKPTPSSDEEREPRDRPNARNPRRTHN